MNAHEVIFSQLIIFKERKVREIEGEMARPFGWKVALILEEDYCKLTTKKIPTTRLLTTCKIGLSQPAAQDRPPFSREVLRTLNKERRFRMRFEWFLCLLRALHKLRKNSVMHTKAWITWCMVNLLIYFKRSLHVFSFLNETIWRKSFLTRRRKLHDWKNFFS